MLTLHVIRSKWSEVKKYTFHTPMFIELVHPLGCIVESGILRMSTKILNNKIKAKNRIRLIL
jgi:hypothetical protein